MRFPEASTDGIISFTGGVPRGFVGDNGNIFRFTLKAQSVGEALISFDNLSILLNDGLGTQLKDFIMNPLKITILDSTTP